MAKLAIVVDRQRSITRQDETDQHEGDGQATTIAANQEDFHEKTHINATCPTRDGVDIVFAQTSRLLHGHGVTDGQ